MTCTHDIIWRHCATHVVLICCWWTEDSITNHCARITKHIFLSGLSPPHPPGLLPSVWTWIYWTCRQSTVVAVAANVKQLNTDKCSSGPSRPWYRMCHLISQMFDLFLWASCVLYHYVSHHLYHNRSHYLVVFNTGMRSQLYLGHLHRRHAFTVCVPSYNYEPWTICVNSGQRREAPAPAVGWDVISCPSSGDRQRIICLKFSNSFSLLILNIRR